MQATLLSEESSQLSCLVSHSLCLDQMTFHAAPRIGFILWLWSTTICRPLWHNTVFSIIKFWSSLQSLKNATFILNPKHLFIHNHFSGFFGWLILTYRDIPWSFHLKQTLPLPTLIHHLQWFGYALGLWQQVLLSSAMQEAVEKGEYVK